jgi:hypothetical protein
VNERQADDSKQPTVEVTLEEATAARRRRSPRWKLVPFAIVPVVCLCSLVLLLILGFFSKGIVEGVAANATWENTADQFMQAMRDREIERAYAMFGRAGKEEFNLQELQELTTGSRFVLFQGYRELDLESWEITRNLEGTFATAEGSATYSGGYTGRWTFTFVQEEEEWRVYSIYVWVPWDKIDAFAQQ